MFLPLEGGVLWDWVATVNLKTSNREDRTNFPPQGNKRLTCKFLIFRNTPKWRVKHACTASLDFVNLKTFVRERTMKKSVKIFLGAKEQKLAKKDIQKSVKKTPNWQRMPIWKRMCLPTYKVSNAKSTCKWFGNKIEALESLVNEMGQKIMKLEGELKDIKHAQTKRFLC